PPETGADERSPEDRARYRIYAGMVWNFLETVEDRCAKDPALELTWYPVLLVEKRRHMAWMRDAGNAELFKESFRKRHCPDCAPPARPGPAPGLVASTDPAPSRPLTS